MRGGTRAFLSAMAAILVAVHTVLWPALTPIAAVPAADPFAVICRSGVSAPDEHASAPNPLMLAHACGHCTLCGASLLLLTPDQILAARLEPQRIVQLPSPLRTTRHDTLATDPKLARGPPAFA